MRATPSFRRLASTIAREPSSCVMCEVSMRAPSAMPTRSAPSSRALALISAAVSGLRNISTQLFLLALELLHLPGHHALVALGPDPAAIPFGQPGDRRAGFAIVLVLLVQGVLLGRALGNVLVHVREVRVIVVADRTHREAARAVAEGADHAQQALPEAEQVARLQHLRTLRCR